MRCIPCTPRSFGIGTARGGPPGILRAFSLLLCTGKSGEVRLFLRKSRDGSGCSVNTRSETAVVDAGSTGGGTAKVYGGIDAGRFAIGPMNGLLELTGF